MRLIDAEALKKCKVYSEERREYVVAVYNIDNAPTAEERPRGAWEMGGFCFSTMSYKCPFCKSKTLERTKFCSECGADMRGGGESDPN